MNNQNNILKQETEIFVKNKNNLLKNSEGKYVLIKADQIIGIFDTHENAYDEGIKKFGNEPMLIKLIEEKDESLEIPSLMVGMLTLRKP
ncbi:MAG: hypothetical protein WCO33_00455 [bacterium]